MAAGTPEPGIPAAGTPATGVPAAEVIAATLAGPVIRNETKEALLEERESRFWAFTVGVDPYAALLLRV